MKTLKCHCYYKYCWIDMMELYHQLHSIPNHPTQHENSRTNDTKGVAFTKYNYIENAWTRENPITLTEIIEWKWRDNMINCTSWLITLQTWRNERTDKPQNYMPPYYYMCDIQIQIYTNVKNKKNIKSAVGLICPMWHLSNLAIYAHLISQYGLWFTTTRIESTILHTQGEPISQWVVIWLVVLPWFWKIRFQFCTIWFRFEFRKKNYKV